MPSIKVRLLVSINRNQTLEDAQETLAAIKEFNSPYIVGIELSGDPRSGSFDTFSALIDEFRQESGLKVSIHCAEVEEQMNETQAIIDFNPDRLGHCVWMTEEQLEQVIAKGIPVEVCPTSNLKVYPDAFGVVQRLPQLKKLQENNSNFIICTDDTMLMSTNISTEYFEYCNAYAITLEQMKQRLVRNVDAIFDDSCKEWLRE